MFFVSDSSFLHSSFLLYHAHPRKSEQARSNILDSDALEVYSADSGGYHIACKRSGKMKYSIGSKGRMLTSVLVLTFGAPRPTRP